MKSANMKIFNENLVPSVKPSVVNTRQTTKRTALGEITNKIVDESKMKLKKKIEVKTETANATMVNMNQQANAAAAARRVPIQQPQKTSTVVTTKPLVKETHVLPVPNPEPIDDVVEDDLEEGEDDIEVFEDIPSESGEPMDIEEHAAFRDIAQPHPVQTRIMDEIWDSEEDVDSEEVCMPTVNEHVELVFHTRLFRSKISINTTQKILSFALNTSITSLSTSVRKRFVRVSRQKCVAGHNLNF